MPSIVLASGSQYRAALLSKLRLDFTVCSRDIDETALPGESAEALAGRLSLAKTQAISSIYPEHFIIGSDQVAVCKGRFLHKPGDLENAVRQLKAQSGQVVRFYTGLCVLNSASGEYLSDMDVCAVHFRSLNEQQIRRYVDLEQPFDCAGSFKAEGLGIALFTKIEGEDPNALIGLPLIKLTALLSRFGVEVI